MSQWKIQSDVSIYFITTTIVEWQHVFVSSDLFDVLIDSLQYCIANKGLHLHRYELLPNHTHYIVSTISPGQLSAVHLVPKLCLGTDRLKLCFK
jgi:REP element-mobilizing transposase RayT